MAARHALVHPRRRLAEDQSLLRVREQQHEFRGQREVGQWPVDRVLHLTLQNRDGRHLLGAHVIQPAHGLQGFLQLAAMCRRCRRQVMRVDADGAQGMIRRRGGKGARCGFLPETAPCGHGAVKGRNARGRDVAERHGNGWQGQFQRSRQLVGKLRVGTQWSSPFVGRA